MTHPLPVCIVASPRPPVRVPGGRGGVVVITLRRYRGSHSSIEQRPADEIEDRAEEREEQITQRAWSVSARPFRETSGTAPKVTNSNATYNLLLLWCGG